MNLGYAIPHEIRIKASANMGFIVKVDCAEFVATTVENLVNALGEYLRNPDKWEKEYNALPGRGRVEAVEVPPSEPLPETTAETASE